MTTKKLEVATVGGGCFWCTEAVFNHVRGVEEVISGYTGGNAPGKPTYREICSGLTGHAEVVKVTFDANIISYKDIIEIFMTTHDPTTLNRQGADVGTQYRSVIYYYNDTQKEIANRVLEELNPLYNNQIVTEVSPMGIFYEAEKEHQEFYQNNPDYGYCTYVIDPKLNKLRELHADKLN
ncbi:Peptide-methionine (S)-S-oxide reductase MsrA [Mesoflavibacter sp. HG96]|uniref:Peptide methionine sulfoxide reductase MsrA n=1 Tax=Mesoflavibacter profundi TaxID=2708110 RepID=A0ABT4S2F9_9FLAO|nr:MULTISPECIES: peptide-methionine (S)-S-oxide reductase MsrA [Mesoflavibacter]MDA0178259.1 peptide-methionine (S)-S-oxide reductase MsrA [Mesoflavibacter profundi]QIJ89221.1 Peptide-methionine (S)-S-oxide reductase MsrA [Mesoflavibacter sp. HG96]QIJ91949.1 Peptide-methionine (S)-S-oxide reductase MsrA [Mesoflavibacter sp. HG37]